MNIDATLEFVKRCVLARRIYWTHHVNMRMRGISRVALLEGVDTFEIIEMYPDDKYLPSCLVYLEYEALVYHAVMALDMESNALRIVTAYQPDPDEWDTDLRKRRQP